MDESVEKRGRRRKDDAKTTKLQVRIDEKESEMLGKICENLDMNTSEAMRCALKHLYKWCEDLDKSFEK